MFNGLSDQPATLGRYFLTAAYLMVDHDAETFTLWQANPTTRSNLVKVANDESRCGEPQTSQPAANPTGSPTDTASSDKQPASSEAQVGLGTGVIAGIAAGGGVFLIGVGLGLFLFLRWKKRKAVQSLPPPYNPDPAVPPEELYSKYQQGYPQEIQGSQGFYVSELRGQDHHVYEMDGGHHQRR